jgi:hypothetical protein
MRGPLCLPVDWAGRSRAGRRSQGGCALKRTVGSRARNGLACARGQRDRRMPTKEHKRHARGLVEALESRVHAGPSVSPDEIVGAQTFLEQHDFSPASDYFSRLARLQDRLRQRPLLVRPEKRNYGGTTSGGWVQLQSIYDHVILSVCYAGDFNSRRGRVKLSHRFNQAGRIEFVELKFLHSLQPCLDGALRKLVVVADHPALSKDWFEADAYALRVLPQELVFLHNDLFRHPRAEILAWLVNLGHRGAADLLHDLRTDQVNGCVREASSQLNLAAVRSDAVALPILGHAAALEATVECNASESALVRYVRR